MVNKKQRTIGGFTVQQFQPSLPEAIFKNSVMVFPVGMWPVIVNLVIMP